MKKNLFLSAAALAGMMSMASCSSEEEVKPQNGKREEVKTSFTLSVGSVKHGTRMIADAVQENSESESEPKFKGMTGIQLFPFKGSPDANLQIAITPIRLADFTTFDNTAVNAKIYSNVTIPVGVDHFVFYGMIPDKYKGNGELRASYERNSLTTTSTLGNDIYFNLVTWNKDLTLDDINSNENAIRILNALNDINSVLTTEIANANLAAETTQEKALEACQSAWITMRAGSSASVLALAEKLYNRIKGMGDNDYAKAVSAEILDHFTELSGDINKGYKLSWNTTTNFPTTGDIKLPDGAVSVQYDDSNNKFSYVANSVDGMVMTDVAKYMHPARLSYFVKTQAMTRTAPYLTKDNPTTWSEDLYKEYESSPVNLATQSVILRDQIQYAVGRLDARVKIADVSLYDSGSGVKESADKDPQLVIAPAQGYPLSAVLIGGQKQVNWDFTTSNSDVTYTIYDNEMTSNNIVAKKGDYSDVNHTLALETKEGETIKVCLEFTNTGNDFYGKDHQIIPSGSKFYLIADLKPETDGQGTPDFKKQVFKQDYITTAKLTIGANSLKNAYNVIPDLRSPKLELGLSVDLKWQQGITFEQDFNS